MADRLSYQDNGEPGEVSIGDGEGHHKEAVGEVRLEQDGGKQAVAEDDGGRDDDGGDDGDQIEKIPKSKFPHIVKKSLRIKRIT